MRVRLKFQKYGAMKFVGHLDVMRYFQKAFRRAKFDNKFSQGYNPRQILSFASPLGLGLTSDGEYMDIQLNSSDSPDLMIKQINSVLTEGFRIKGFYILKEIEEDRKTPTAMSLLAAADYMVSLKDGYESQMPFKNLEEFQKEFIAFMKQDEIFIEKKTKKSSKIIDIKSMMRQWDESSNPGNHETEDLSYDLRDTVADEYKNGIKLYLQLDTGSRSNLKPELVMEAFCNYHHIVYQEFAWQVHRLELYARDEDSGKLIPLKDVN